MDPAHFQERVVRNVHGAISSVRLLRVDPADIEVQVMMRGDVTSGSNAAHHIRAGGGERFGGSLDERLCAA